MFAKLVVVILTIGACACTLLSVRQARLQAAHELARAQLRVRECDDRLWAVRAEIGRRVMPERVRQMADALGSFRPMLPMPGDTDRHGMYAHALPAVDPALEAPIKKAETVPSVQAQAQAQVRTVSQTHADRQKQPAAPSGKSKAQAKAQDKTKPTGKPSDKGAPKATSEPRAKPQAKPSRHAAAIGREPRQ